MHIMDRELLVQASENTLSRSLASILTHPTFRLDNGTSTHCNCHRTWLIHQPLISRKFHTRRKFSVHITYDALRRSFVRYPTERVYIRQRLTFITRADDSQGVIASMRV